MFLFPITNSNLIFITLFPYFSVLCKSAAINVATVADHDVLFLYFYLWPRLHSLIFFPFFWISFPIILLLQAVHFYLALFPCNISSEILMLRSRLTLHCPSFRPNFPPPPLNFQARFRFPHDVLSSLAAGAAQNPLLNHHSASSMDELPKKQSLVIVSPPPTPPHPNTTCCPKLCLHVNTTGSHL